MVAVEASRCDHGECHIAGVEVGKWETQGLRQGHIECNDVESRAS